MTEHLRSSVCLGMEDRVSDTLYNRGLSSTVDIWSLLSALELVRIPGKKSNKKAQFAAVLNK